MAGSTPTILVVDDDVDICRNMSDILVDLGYDVDTAHDGPSALELAGRKAYDVALLDLKMPGMDGLTLYRRLKEVRAGTVALLVTAFASEATAHEALAAGAWRVVPKPVDFNGLLGLIDEAVGQPLLLIVDDDRDLCTNLWDIFRQRGFRVSLAHDEIEAAASLRESQYHVVLIDMRLPGSDGSSVFRQVREASPDARTLLITGTRPETDQAVSMILAEGADAVCYKPFDMNELLTTLTRLLGPTAHRLR
ncbi:response regulator [soil metagenome]